MTLKEKCRAHNITLSELAHRVGVNPSRLSQINKGDACSAALALKIEAATGGGIQAGSLSLIIAQARAA